MIKTLRKRHLQVWIIMAVLMPLGIIGAIIVIPGAARDKLFQPAISTALPLVLKTINRQDYTVNLRGNADSSALQLEWINKRILTYPSALIYQVSSSETDIEKDADNALVIGRIESKGTYHFLLKKDTLRAQHFVLYDIIHHQKIDSLTF
jgi:hypothetical protein